MPITTYNWRTVVREVEAKSPQKKHSRFQFKYMKPFATYLKRPSLMSIFKVKPWDAAGRGSDWAADARARHDLQNSRRRAGASRVPVGQHPDDPRFPSPSPDAAQNPPPQAPTFVTVFGFLHSRSWLWPGHSLAELMKLSVQMDGDI